MDWNQFWSVGGFWIGVGGFIVGIAGVIIALVTRRKREFSYYQKGINVIGDYKSKINDLSVLYKNSEIENLSVCRLAFWNGGNEAIGKDDISSNDPLMVKIKEPYKILDVFIIESSSKANGISVISDSSGGYLINFDYLNPNNGGVLQIIHTAKSSSSLFLQGEIKGIKEIIKYINPKYLELQPIPILGLPFGIILFLMGVVAIFFTNTSELSPKIAGGVFIAGSLFSIAEAIVLRRNKNIIPGELKAALLDLPFTKNGPLIKKDFRRFPKKRKLSKKRKILIINLFKVL